MITEEQIIGLIPGNLILIDRDSVLKFVEIRNDSEFYEFEILIPGMRCFYFCNIGDSVIYTMLQIIALFNQFDLLSEEEYKKIMVFQC